MAVQGTTCGYCHRTMKDYNYDVAKYPCAATIPGVSAPPFVGDNYFCESGTLDHTNSSGTLGLMTHCGTQRVGCASGSTCCEERVRLTLLLFSPSLSHPLSLSYPLLLSFSTLPSHYNPFPFSLFSPRVFPSFLVQCVLRDHRNMATQSSSYVMDIQLCSVKEKVNQLQLTKLITCSKLLYDCTYGGTIIMCVCVCT